MKYLFIVCLFLHLLLSCNPPENPVLVEQWKPVFQEITDPILDSRVNGDEWHLITNDHFYRIREESIIEKRVLTGDRYNDYSHPILGRQLVFRLINFDTVAYLEFQPVKPGGNTVRVSYDDLGDDKLTLPITHGFGARNTGRFDANDNFLFVGFDYPSLQQFATLLEISYDSIANTILQISLAERKELNPVVVAEWDNPWIEDVFEVDGVIFINASDNGVYRYYNGDLQYFQSMTLSSVIKEGVDILGVDIDRAIHRSNDKGLTWAKTGFELFPGRILEKAGDYYVETNEWNQLHNIGKDLVALDKFLFYETGQNPFTYAELTYYDHNYYLFGNIAGKYQVFKRTDLTY